MDEYDELNYEVIEAVLSGHTASFEKIIERFEAMVFDLTYKHIQNYEDARDLTQEIFIKVFENLDKYDKNYKFFSWIYRISLNEIYSYLKRNKWKQKTISIEKVKFFFVRDKNEKEDYKEAMLHKIQKIIDKEKDRDKQIFSLFYYSDYSIEEISKLTDETKSNVKVILHRLRNKIKEKLEVEVKK
ncbi:MAG: sigma-70 family RNA polymerase sigma factor [Candidatus Mcinerneyibacterium aminivorans]|jgi:RNA polymerase sigma-70 factor (ECF subfamily)|uniref:Sigma-70 family RNA polymerase sigma factor n=1 Tax=Candidatus Mcinerneyibacterium aminivorans TaxID=2703815 RepID=A0A5D0MJY3_9BACT|nr:MAG: sigma-70 family RNA polymerase sigma factor [Candidatus Mcinerneyibacterium aminivorans]